jgi:putative ABC transport system substrate-binding protein
MAGLVGVGAPTFGQQSTRKFRVAAFFSMPPALHAPYRAALARQLAVHGFVEGKNLSIDSRGASGVGLEWNREQAAQLLAEKPDAFFTTTSRVTQAVLAEAPAVPLVFAWVSDPVISGFVKDYSRPGGNATGVSSRLYDIAIKRLELLRELLPKANRVVLAGPLYFPEVQAAISPISSAAQRLGLEPKTVDTGYSYPAAVIEQTIDARSQALLALHDYTAHGERFTGEQIVRLVNEKRVPAIFADSEMVDVGGLMSLGGNRFDDVRRAADMLARVLRGAKPAELAVDQASRFELTVNLKTARLIGVRVPQSILLRANRVIE